MSSPRRIVNNFRLQNLIEEEIEIANTLIKKSKTKELSNHDLIDLALTYLEVGDWNKVSEYAIAANTIEETKPEHQQNKEILATALYCLGSKSRELNDCDTAHTQLNQALSSATSVWLISNIYRNIGLVYLKQKNFILAAENFKKAFDQANNNSELKGSLPALHNYYALSTVRAALQAKQDPTTGLQLFEKTTSLYQDIFIEKQISSELQLKSHDWQSHQYHRGMILCEMVESQNTTDKDTLNKAEILLIGSLAGRKANHADHQRLGDVSVWLGRVHANLNNVDEARKYFGDALKYFRLAFPNTTAESAPQIKDVLARLSALPLSVTSTKQSNFTYTNVPITQSEQHHSYNIKFT